MSNYIETKVNELIKFKEFSVILESLDSKWGMSLLNHTRIGDRDLSEFDHEFNITNRKLYSLSDGGWFTTYERDGSTEIHHYDSSGSSEGKFHAAPPNMKFVGTMFDHAKALLNSGKSVKVVAPKGDPISKYHRIARVVAARHGATVGDIVDTKTGYDEIDSMLSEFKITHRPLNHIGAFQESARILKSLTQSVL